MEGAIKGGGTGIVDEDAAVSSACVSDFKNDGFVDGLLRVK